jgi:hypothetical protein
MSAKLARLLEIWELQSMPACDEGMMLADFYVGKCLEGCDIHDEAEALPKRNAIIRACHAALKCRKMRSRVEILH